MSPASCLLPPACFFQDYQCLFLDEYQSSPDTCPPSPECNVDTGCGGTDGVCAYCPPDGTQCTVVEGVTSTDECGRLSACELPSGDVVFNLTADQCDAVPGVCSGECAEPICRPYSRYVTAACEIWNVTSQAECDQLTGGGGTFDGVTCVTYDFTATECADLGSSYTVNYVTCESLNVTECDYAHMNDIQINDLKCGVSPIGPCSTQEACESVGGTCSDSFWMTSSVDFSYESSTTTRRFYYGVCTVSGVCVCVCVCVKSCSGMGLCERESACRCVCADVCMSRPFPFALTRTPAQATVSMAQSLTALVWIIP